MMPINGHSIYTIKTCCFIGILGRSEYAFGKNLNSGFGDKKFSMWFISGKRVFAVEGTLSWQFNILFLIIYKGRGT